MKRLKDGLLVQWLQVTEVKVTDDGIRSEERCEVRAGESSVCKIHQADQDMNV